MCSKVPSVQHNCVAYRSLSELSSDKLESSFVPHSLDSVLLRDKLSEKRKCTHIYISYQKCPETCMVSLLYDGKVVEKFHTCLPDESDE